MTRRNPKNYDGTRLTTHQIKDVLKDLKAKVDEARQKQPDEILRSWPEIIGPGHAGRTRAESFKAGILTVRVKHSTLLSLLNQYEKGKLLAKLQQQFPASGIREIVFRIG